MAKTADSPDESEDRTQRESIAAAMRSIHDEFGDRLSSRAFPAEVVAELQAVLTRGDNEDSEYVRYLTSRPMAECDPAWIAARFSSLCVLQDGAFGYFLPLLLLVALSGDCAANGGEYVCLLAQRLTDHVNRKPFQEPVWLRAMPLEKRRSVLPAIQRLREWMARLPRVEKRLDILITDLAFEVKPQ